MTLVVPEKVRVVVLQSLGYGVSKLGIVTVLVLQSYNCTCPVPSISDSCSLMDIPGVRDERMWCQTVTGMVSEIQ
jgi:hypothetical protein